MIASVPAKPTDTVCPGADRPTLASAEAFQEPGNGDLNMSQRLVIVGAGFAGMYAALSAARLREARRASTEELEIVLVSPEPKRVTDL